MVEGNVQKWTDMRLNKDSFIISMWAGSWEATIDLGIVGIEQLSMRLMYDPLFWAGVGQMSLVSYPNAISMDYIGVGKTGEYLLDLSFAEHEFRAMAIGLNLYMVSENCKIGIGKRLIDMDPPKGMLPAVVHQLQVVNGSVQVDRQLFGMLDIKPVVEQELARRQRMEMCPP